MSKQWLLYIALMIGFGLKILITQYFKDMRNGDKKSMQQLKDVLRHAGLTKLANRLQNES